MDGGGSAACTSHSQNLIRGATAAQGETNDFRAAIKFDAATSETL